MSRDLPPKVRNKLGRWPQPMLVELQGPGPFQLPLLTTARAANVSDSGGIELELETEYGQAVQIVLTAEAAAIVRSLLSSDAARRKSTSGSST